MHFSIQLSKSHRYLLYLVWLILCLTGVYFAYSQDWQQQFPSDFSTASLKIHGISAALMSVLIGSLLSVHIRLSLRIKRNLITGLAILSMMGLLMFSGTALYYSPEDWHENVKWLHIWVGLIAILLLPLHILFGYLSRSRLKSKKLKHALSHDEPN